MGIYIKGMEMPKEQPLIIKISPDGTVYMSQGIYGIGHGVAKAVPVPSHGRLIDADALKDLYHHSIHNSDIDTAWICTIRRSIDAAPTIIEAEEGE